MNRNLINRCSPTRLLSPLALIVLTGLGGYRADQLTIADRTAGDSKQRDRYERIWPVLLRVSFSPSLGLRSRPGAWSYTTATLSLPTSHTSWVLGYHPQAGFIRKSS